MPREFSERAWHVFSEKGDDYTEYSMLDEQGRVMGRRTSTVAAVATQGNFLPFLDSNIANLPEGVDEDDD